eukprot:m.108645 g.108645  ORF g.108645 m.108645 type:complete len:508 (-) comp13973_c0_seq2:928-2451(-)
MSDTSKRRRVQKNDFKSTIPLCKSQPVGNLYLLPVDKREVLQRHHRAGLGVFASLPEELLGDVLASITPASLCAMCGTSRVMRAYASLDDLWRVHVLREFGGEFQYCSEGWYTTYLHCRWNKMSKTHEMPNPKQHCKVDDLILYSDFLHTAQTRWNHPILEEWLAEESIPRRANLSAAEFRKEYEVPNIPLILTDKTASWLSCSRWLPETLEKSLAGKKFEVFDEYTEVVEMEFSSFMSYARNCRDELPLYLFEPEYLEKHPAFGNEYSVPDVFEEDLFSLLENERPDYRWVLVGGPRSGAGFHQDPNRTAAWNTVISGRKKWVLFPPSMRPPGVHENGDVDAESLLQWFIRYFEEMKDLRKSDLEIRNRPWECVTKPGETIFIPHGWWHMALNLDICVAVTHNFVSSVNLPDVLRFLRDNKDEVCGKTIRTKDENGRFTRRKEKRDLFPDFVKNLKKDRGDLSLIVEESLNNPRHDSVASLFKVGVEQKAATLDSGKHMTPFQFGF